MKAASPTLATLLADNRQAVAWETFTFTLQDGSSVVYTTRDPDAPQVIPPGASQWLLDTFVGDGTLSSHVGEVGASWTGETSDFVLTGNGSVYLDENNVARTVQASGKPGATDPYYVTAAVVLQDASLFQQAQFTVYDAAQDIGWSVSVFIDTDFNLATVSGSIFGPTTFAEIPSTSSNLPASATPRVLSAALTGSGSVITVSLDGVELGSASTGGESVSTAEAVFLLALTSNDAGDGPISINSISGDYL